MTSDTSYPTKITTEIGLVNRMLLSEHRAWRASELKGEALGLARALEIFYTYGYNTSPTTEKS